MPILDSMKIEWRSKSEFYVAAVVKAYKHVRDCIANWKPIDEKIRNLVEMIPHRTYRDGFLFHNLQEFPDWEISPEERKTTTEEKKDHELKINFANISKQCRWCVFGYLENKSIDAFKLIPNEDKFCCFRFLDNKNKTAYDLVPSEDRFRCFDYLEESEKKRIQQEY
jgi:hypothetical protein